MGNKLAGPYYIRMDELSSRRAYFNQKYYGVWSSMEYTNGFGDRIWSEYGNLRLLYQGQIYWAPAHPTEMDLNKLIGIQVDWHGGTQILKLTMRVHK